MDAKARFTERIWDLSERVDAHRQSFEPPADPPDEQQAMEFLRDGAGQAISLFVEARTGQHMIHFPPEEYEALETAMNDWLELYAACYGADIEADFALQKAAQLLLDTRNIKDVAEVLTRIPDEAA